MSGERASRVCISDLAKELGNRMPPMGGGGGGGVVLGIVILLLSYF